MIAKVKYEETIVREAQVEVDEEEFLDWVNGAADADEAFATVSEALEADSDLLKEFLEDGDPHVWQQASDPSGLGYDQNLLEASL